MSAFDDKFKDTSGSAPIMVSAMSSGLPDSVLTAQTLRFVYFDPDASGDIDAGSGDSADEQEEYLRANFGQSPSHKRARTDLAIEEGASTVGRSGKDHRAPSVVYASKAVQTSLEDLATESMSGRSHRTRVSAPPAKDARDQSVEDEAAQYKADETTSSTWPEIFKRLHEMEVLLQCLAEDTTSARTAAVADKDERRSEWFMGLRTEIAKAQKWAEQSAEQFDLL